MTADRDRKARVDFPHLLPLPFPSWLVFLTEPKAEAASPISSSDALQSWQGLKKPPGLGVCLHSTREQGKRLHKPQHPAPSRQLRCCSRERSPEPRELSAEPAERSATSVWGRDTAQHRAAPLHAFAPRAKARTPPLQKGTGVKLQQNDPKYGSIQRGPAAPGLAPGHSSHRC